MREYRVHFSFYSEEWGNFDDISYKVEAETPFEAREKAWLAFDQDEEAPFRSNVKQFAVTWQPDSLSMKDYFNARAADIKQYLGYLKHVAIQNDRINGADKSTNDSQAQFYRGALNELDDVSKDLYGHLGMEPPSLYEELHYAHRICEQLGYGDREAALYEKIDKARKWDTVAMRDIRDLFRDGYITLNKETEVFKEKFSRKGVFPFYANPEERDYTYISRWQNKAKLQGLASLERIGESDVVQNSAGHFYYEGQTLLVDPRYLEDGQRKPENKLWTLCAVSETGECVKDGKILVENAVSGERMTCSKNAFLGILRPDIASRLDSDALKAEYTQAHQDTHFEAEERSRGLAPVQDAEAEDEEELEA